MNVFKKLQTKTRPPKFPTLEERRKHLDPYVSTKGLLLFFALSAGFAGLLILTVSIILWVAKALFQ